jgi:hypothetical protein
MMQLELKNHPVWNDLTEVLEQLDSNALIQEHLEACDYKVCGYWDEQDQYYDEISLPRTLSAELISSAIAITATKRFLKLSFVLSAIAQPYTASAEPQTIGEVLLVYNESLEFIDENWHLAIESPLLK